MPKSTRVVGLHSTTDHMARPKTAAATLTVPGAARPALRRSARDNASGLSAYVVAAPPPAKGDNICVSLRRDGRLVGATLRGHAAAISDMEFLAAPGAAPGAELHVLGSCDANGVVFLWFLEVVLNASVGDALRVRRKYSFYSLRKSTEAHYARIRLAGAPEQGYMVLVPNDGSNVRVIRFACEAKELPGGQVSAPAIAPPPQKHGVAAIEHKPDADADVRPGAAVAAAGLGGAALAGTAAAAAAYGDSEQSVEDVEDEDTEAEDAAVDDGVVDDDVDVLRRDTVENVAPADYRAGYDDDEDDEELNDDDIPGGKREFYGDADEMDEAGLDKIGGDAGAVYDQGQGYVDDDDDGSPKMPREYVDSDEEEEDYGADEVVDDLDDDEDDDVESQEFKDALGKPQSHMAM